MNKIKEFLLKARDFIEIILPSISFAIMFIVFITQVIARYVFKHPIVWSYEVTVMGFSWTVILGACYAMRERTHVSFTMIYDALPKKTAATFRLAGNILILVAFLMLVIPSIQYLHFVGFQKTSVFRIPLTIIYCPFAYFLFAIIGYTITDVRQDIQTIKQINKEEKEGK